MPPADQIVVLDRVCHYLSIRYGRDVSPEWVAERLAGKRIRKLGDRVRHGQPRWYVRLRRKPASGGVIEDQVLVQPAGDEWVAVGVVER